ncbi:MAG: hypothetical protein ACI4PX_06155 [Ruminococcus sp.]
MGIFDSIFGNGGNNSNDGSMPNYLKNKFNISDDIGNSQSTGKYTYWTCPRCGTTNFEQHAYCKECKNRRPY